MVSKVNTKIYEKKLLKSKLKTEDTLNRNIKR